MTFFSAEDERRRQQALQTEAGGTAINDAYHRELAERLLPETLRQIREAYARGERNVTVKHENEPITPPQKAPSTKWAYEILQELVTAQTGKPCEARGDYSEYEPDGIRVFMKFD